jgi:hypothetical protein
MPGEILLSTTYFPPQEYFSYIKNADSVLIEQEENYIKQTYRNRCKILTANGVLYLSVPVSKGSSLKTQIKDIRIDYSKRWQQIHVRSLAAAYGRSPYFQFYSEQIEIILMKSHKYLIDLNDEILEKCLDFLNIDKYIQHTSFFRPVIGSPQDLRYKFSPKKDSVFKTKHYIQVFGEKEFFSNLSILDLVFNIGPDSCNYL